MNIDTKTLKKKLANRIKNMQKELHIMTNWNLFQRCKAVQYFKIS